MNFCNCALPAMRGNSDCCKGCLNNKNESTGEYSFNYEEYIITTGDFYKNQKELTEL